MDSLIKRCLLMALAICLTLSVKGSVGQTTFSPPTQADRAALRRRLAQQKALPPVRGLVFHCCSCAVPCSCMFNGKDIAGCNIVRVFHITDGGYMGKGLTGLTAVLVPHPEDLKKKADGLRQDGKPIDAVLDLPSGLTKRQEQDLSGLLVENYMSIAMNTVLHRQAPISLQKHSDGYEVEIPSVFHARMQAAKGADGKQIIADNLPLGEGSRWFFGRAVVHNYQDSEEKAWNWKLPQTNGSWTFFAWVPHIDPSDEYEANKKSTTP